jgi:purine-binding chemotaxis protein CheW
MQGTGMSTKDSKLEGKVAEMRGLFDESFAVALREQVTAPEPMLAITVEGEPFALRVREIDGLAVSKEKIVPVPSRVPELLGLTGVRGVVVPVFSLARLLGFDSERGQMLWLVFCGERHSPIALAFEGMERQFEVASGEIFARQEAHGSRYVSATVGEGATLRGVISVPALVASIKARGAGKTRQ